MPHSRRGEIGTNRNLELIRMLFNWGIAKGYYDRENPFRRHGQRVMAFAKEQARTRRLQPDEEAALIRFAGPHLQALIIAAIETGARKGELLALQWRDLDRDTLGRFQTIRLRPESTKTDKPRSIPISPRLRAVLEMRNLGPDGEPLPATAHVFGNEVGERIDSVKVAWRATCKRAGITGLTFHDLRREHGSRLLEGGVNLLTVSRLLGHARVSTTDTYLKASEQVTHKELQAFHRRRGKNYPSFTQSPKPNPPGASKALATKRAKHAVS